MGEASGEGINDEEDPHHGDLVDGALPAGAHHDLTDEQWAILASILETLLPIGRRSGRPRRWTSPQLIDGIWFHTRTGCPWRDVPERDSTWQSV